MRVSASSSCSIGFLDRAATMSMIELSGSEVQRKGTAVISKAGIVSASISHATLCGDSPGHPQGRVHGVDFDDHLEVFANHLARDLARSRTS